MIIIGAFVLLRGCRCALVPVFSFGEPNAFDQVRGDWYVRLQRTVRRWTGVPFVVFRGRTVFGGLPIGGLFSALPYRRPITTVGKRFPHRLTPPSPSVAVAKALLPKHELLTINTLVVRTRVRTRTCTFLYSHRFGRGDRGANKFFNNRRSSSST